MQQTTTSLLRGWRAVYPNCQNWSDRGAVTEHQVEKFSGLVLFEMLFALVFQNLFFLGRGFHYVQ
jgi:hypothetical protein